MNFSEDELYKKLGQHPSRELRKFAKAKGYKIKAATKPGTDIVSQIVDAMIKDERIKPVEEVSSISIEIVLDNGTSIPYEIKGTPDDAIALSQKILTARDPSTIVFSDGCVTFMADKVSHIVISSSDEDSEAQAMPSDDEIKNEHMRQLEEMWEQAFESQDNAKVDNGEAPKTS